MSGRSAAAASRPLESLQLSLSWSRSATGRLAGKAACVNRAGSSRIRRWHKDLPVGDAPNGGGTVPTKRELVIELAVMTAIGAALAALGPFGSFGMGTFAER